MSVRLRPGVLIDDALANALAKLALRSRTRQVSIANAAPAETAIPAGTRGPDANVRYVRPAIYVWLSLDISVLVYRGQYAGPVKPAQAGLIVAPGAPMCAYSTPAAVAWRHAVGPRRGGRRAGMPTRAERARLTRTAPPEAMAGREARWRSRGICAGPSRRWARRDAGQAPLRRRRRRISYSCTIA